MPFQRSPFLPAALLLAFSGAVCAQPQTLSESVRQALEDAGWQARATEDGSIELRRSPPGLPNDREAEASLDRDPPPSEISSATEGPTRGLVSLSDEDLSRLRAQGWRVETDATGAILLFPAGKQKAESVSATTSGMEEAGAADITDTADIATTRGGKSAPD